MSMEEAGASEAAAVASILPGGGEVGAPARSVACGSTPLTAPPIDAPAYVEDALRWLVKSDTGVVQAR
jgi:hypothetical protein